jgi:hypothetical protein
MSSLINEETNLVINNIHNNIKFKKMFKFKMNPFKFHPLMNMLANRMNVIHEKEDRIDNTEKEEEGMKSHELISVEKDIHKRNNEAEETAVVIDMKNRLEVDEMSSLLGTVTKDTEVITRMSMNIENTIVMTVMDTVIIEDTEIEEMNAT